MCCRRRSTPPCPKCAERSKVSRATVFARERDSLDLIKGLCDARLAHDTAFFFDFAPYRRPGRGTLEAFRSDREATGRPIPPGNVDVSVVSATLDEWLHTLARHALIRTDRAHVLIAGALLGKRVEWAASSTRKLPAIAAFALEGRFPVRRLEAPASPGCAAGAPRAPGDKTPVPGAVRARLTAAGRDAIAAPRAAPDCVAAPRVTVVVLSWNRAAHVHEALRSLRENAELPWRALVVDNASSPATREVLRREAAADPRIALELLDRNLGCAGGRNHAASAADTEFVMFLDDDAEVLPGTLERLVETLDGDPDALAAAAHIVLPDGRTQICGGGFSVADGVVRFEPLGAGRPFEEVAAEPAGPCRWVGGAGVLYRREALSRSPIDTGMAAYFEDNEWGFRVESEVPGSLRRCPSALVLHHQVAKGRLGSSAADVAHAIRFCEPIAHFYARHGLVMEELFGWVESSRARRAGTSRRRGSSASSSSRAARNGPSRRGSTAGWTLSSGASRHRRRPPSPSYSTSRAPSCIACGGRSGTDSRSGTGSPGTPSGPRSASETDDEPRADPRARDRRWLGDVPVERGARVRPVPPHVVFAGVPRHRGPLQGSVGALVARRAPVPPPALGAAQALRGPVARPAGAR